MSVSETERVEAVRSLGIMGTAAEPEFDRLARLAGHIAHASYAHLCFIDDAYQFKKAMDGVPLAQLTSRDEAVCTEVVQSRAPVLIGNLAADPRAILRNLNRQYGFSTYVGVPIRWTDGHVVGAVGALSTETELPSERRLAALTECAGLVTRELLIRKAATDEVRRSAVPVARQAFATPDILRAITRNHLSVLKSVSDGVVVVRADGTINFVNPTAEQILARSAASMLGLTFAAAVGVSSKGAAIPDRDCPVAASLRDGKERLSQRASLLASGRDPVRVEYVVSPVIANTRAIGAVIIFRQTAATALSNGVELRNTLREVARLKEQIAKLETIQSKDEVSGLTTFPDLLSGQSVAFEDLLQVIREEQAQQAMRAQALCGGRTEGPAGAAALLGIKPDTLYKHLSASGEAKPKTVSRIERWREH